MDIINFILWVAFGALAGWIASIITGKNKKMGALANIVTGIIGAFLGGAIMNTFGYQGFTGLNIWSLLVAIGGAVVLIWAVGLITERR